MSHFTVVEIEATDPSCLIDALEACGYKGKIEVHDRPVTLIGYDGRPRLLDGQEVRAEIAIRREHLWEAANDIGFARQPGGRYVAYISEYDRSVRPTWHTDVVKEYGAAKAAKELRAQGWKVEIARDQGRVRVMGVRYA
jgi:hypothetical protein